MRIGILNVKYSPNLGDGAIAECIEAQLRKRIPHAEVFSLDIGGMEDYGTGGSIMGEKYRMMRKLERLPRFLRQWIKSRIVPLAMRRKYAGKWRGPLKDCNALVIGGGQLFMDVDHYFPSRISLAVQQAPKGLPIVVHAVGVSDLWTPRGVSMFRRAFKHGRLTQASVRDVKSQEHWARYFAEIMPLVTRDPALLAAESYGPVHNDNRRETTRETGRRLIAFGVSDPADLTQHVADRNTVVFGDIQMYLDTITLLCRKGFDIALFTNGADYEYLDKVGEAVETLDEDIRKHVTVLPRPRRPIELIAQITSADAVVAHRLHANILAYSYGIPHVGLGWDRKLLSFFESIGREDYIITTNENGAQQVLDKVTKALEEGIDARTHERIIGEARADIDVFAQALLREVA